MSTENPILTTRSDARPVALNPGRLVLYAVGAWIVGVTLDRPVVDLLGVEGNAAALVAGVPVFVGAVGAKYLANRGPTARFYPDRVETDDRTVPYDTVSVAVASEGWTERQFGAGSVELVRHGESNLELTALADPDEVDRVLGERLDAPEEQLREGGGRDRPTADRMRRRHDLWGYWEEEEQLPEEAVVDEEEFGEVLDVDVGAADLDDLDEADMSDADGLGDLDAGDVSADAGGAGGGGVDAGGFDGGGGGE